MHALVYQGQHGKCWEPAPDPQIHADTDAIVGVDAVTICGTDLHILKGDVPEVEPGRILGHEAVGMIEEVGSAVRGVAPGDRVLVSCIAACGICRFCRKGRYGQCLGGGGWALDPTPLVTHRFALDDMLEAYDVFSRPGETGALKVVLSRAEDWHGPRPHPVTARRH